MSSIIFCVSYGDIYLFLGISESCSFLTGSELFWREAFEILFLSVFFLLIKSSVPFDVFRIALFEAVLNATVSDYLALSTSFWLVLTT